MKDKWAGLLAGVFFLCWGIFVLATGWLSRLIYAGDAKYVVGGMFLIASIWCFYWVARYWNRSSDTKRKA